MRLKSLVALAVALLILLAGSTHSLAQPQKITLATLEWEPYAGSRLSGKGLTAEIVAAAFKRVGYSVKIEFNPWSETLKLGESGQVDGIFPAYHSKSREAHFVFSVPFAESPLGFYKKSTAVAGPNISQLKRTEEAITFPADPRIDPAAVLKMMKQYKFGVVKGYVNTPAFDAATYLKKVEAASDEENLQNLINGLVDLIFIDRYVAKNIIVKRYPWHLQDFEFMRPALAEKPLYVGFSNNAPGHQKMLKDFNRGLGLVRDEGLLERLANKYGLKGRF